MSRRMRSGRPLLVLGAVESQISRAERHVEQRAVVRPWRVGVRLEAEETAGWAGACHTNYAGSLQARDEVEHDAE
jgi:hypothetical protein